MIIAISSPPPIETNSLAKKIANQHGLKIIEDPTPLICKQYGFQTLYDMPSQLQSEIRERLILEHVQFVKSSESMLLNFSVIEFLADWMRWFWSNTPTEKWEHLLAAGCEAANCYCEIHHLEEGVSHNYNGYIWFDKSNTKQLNSLMKYLYEEMNLKEKVVKS